MASDESLPVARVREQKGPSNTIVWRFPTHEFPGVLSD